MLALRRCMRVFLFALASNAGVAHAQVAVVGGPSSVPPPAGVAPVRWPAVAYSPSDDVYLAVSGAGQVAGYWISGDGAPMGMPFVVGGGAFAQAPRVAYADGAFVVTWHETLASGAVRVRACFVPYGAPMGASFDVSPDGTNWEMGAPAAWSSTSRELLVAWHSTVDTRIYAQRVSETGAMLGAPITIDARAIYFRDPTLAYHPPTDTFFVAYAGCVGTNDCFVDAQRVRAGTGELIGGPIELDVSIDAGYVPEIAYAAVSEEMLVVWDRIEPGSGGFYARTIDGAGTSGAMPVLVTSAVGAYDANALAYDDVSGTLLLVTHGSTAEDAAIELSAAGIALGSVVPFGVSSASGNFNPRVAARTGHAEWLAVTSTEFAQLTSQRFETMTRMVPATDDAGTPSGDASIESDAGVVVDAARTSDAATTIDGGGRPTVSGGCGCRAGGRARPHAVLLLAIAVLALRRTRRARAPLTQGSADLDRA